MPPQTNTIASHTTTSQDGTTIGYLVQGSGPGLILIQGAMGTAHTYAALASYLASSFTVIRPDRRGRGLSPKPYEATHEVARDVEDISAVMEATGAAMLFGLSSGAMIVLEAARTLEGVSRAAVYEPPFYEEGISHEGIAELNRQVEAGELAAAMVTALEVAQTTPAPIKVLPKAARRVLAGAVLFVDGWIGGGEEEVSARSKMRDLVPGIRYDFNVVGGMDGKMEQFVKVDKPVLLISGTRSQEFLRQSVRRLQNVMPQATHVELDGLDHGSPWDGAGSEAVAPVLKDFFGR
ncbi:putative esterase/hydrolase [Pseudohyphozyma bogoriensis]|nr:putative esterase/hydrolase [Pseudohyphozyma bogoriensis]